MMLPVIGVSTDGLRWADLCATIGGLAVTREIITLSGGPSSP